MATSERSPRQTVLIVDDEPLFLSSVAEGLRSLDADYDVLTAADGIEAIRIAEDRPLDLVVTDLKMPDVDGFELIRYLLENHPKTPVIVMTAFGTPAIEESVRAAGVLGYLEKPIDFQVLTERIEESLLRAARGHIQGITLFGFLQLLQMERKTCTLEVSSKGRKAQLHFRDGEMIDAEAGELRGEAALQALTGWDTPKIAIDNVCRATRRTISTPLATLLLEAARLEDEKARGGASGPPARGRPADGAGSRAAGPRSKGATTLHGWLERLLEVDGMLGAALVDLETGACLSFAIRDPSLDLSAAAAASAELVRAERGLAGKLGVVTRAEELLITLEDRLCLLRSWRRNLRLFLLLVLDRGGAHLGMLRLELDEIEEDLGL